MSDGDPFNDIGRSLERLFRLSSSRKVHARQAAAAGAVITQPGLLLLRRLHERGAMPLGELARLADMDPAAAGRQVRLLEGEGLVRRGPGPNDARVTLVRPTGRGRVLARRFEEMLSRHLEDVLSSWSRRDVATFATFLSRFVDDLRTVQYRATASARSA
jgi:DNA-binding MarR family transcriptional regulator